MKCSSYTNMCVYILCIHAEVMFALVVTAGLLSNTQPLNLCQTGEGVLILTLNIIDA